MLGESSDNYRTHAQTDLCGAELELRLGCHIYFLLSGASCSLSLRARRVCILTSVLRTSGLDHRPSMLLER